jgi:hypothetical protein
MSSSFKIVLVATLFALGACTPVNPLAVTTKGASGGGGSGGCGTTTGPSIIAEIVRTNVLNAGASVSSSVLCTVTTINANGTPLAISSATMNPPGGGTVVLAQYLGNPDTFADAGTGWTYQPGQTYTINVSAGGSSYSGSITVPGGSANIPTFLSGGGPITWTNPGTSDFINLSEAFSPFTSTTIRPVSSGSFNTATSNYLTSTGTYMISLFISKANTSCAFGSGANLSSSVLGEDVYSDIDTK